MDAIFFQSLAADFESAMAGLAAADLASAARWCLKGLKKIGE
jgi:hypothetical protein